MDDSVKSILMSRQSTSGRSYFVKRKALQDKFLKQAKSFFKAPSYKQESFVTLNKNSSVKSITSSKKTKMRMFFTDYNRKLKISFYFQPLAALITIQDSIIESKNEINLNNFSTINPNNNYKSRSDLISLVQSQVKKSSLIKNNSIVSRLNSVSSFDDSIGKKRVLKKYVFQTICDQSFNKSLVKKQIVVDCEEKDVQNLSFLPQIDNKISYNYQSNLVQSILSKSNQTKNDSKFCKSDPFYVLQRQITDKFSMQKLKDYRKIWDRKERKRKQLNQIKRGSIRNPSLIYNASLFEKSVNKSHSISQKFNKDAEFRKSRCNWEQELRGRKNKYVTIGEVQSSMKGLKGKGENPEMNVEIKPNYNFFCDKRNFSCEEVYKSSKINSK